MGRNGSQPGNPVTSDFKMLRPYIELAIINENSPSLREVVGVKIGAQSVDGFLGVGTMLGVGQAAGGTVSVEIVTTDAKKAINTVA